MTTKEQLLDLLAAGKSVDELANELAETLNEAKKEHDERVTRETAELKALTEQVESKRQSMRIVVAALRDYIFEHTDLAEELSAEELDGAFGMSDESIDEMIDKVESMVKMVIALKDLRHLEFGL